MTNPCVQLRSKTKPLPRREVLATPPTNQPARPIKVAKRAGQFASGMQLRTPHTLL
ncbi:hypothetical protein HRbin36_01228 [bacterium HR36]|nr:hypothetical protein HRbin36_01228 [bacterium HR36]